MLSSSLTNTDLLDTLLLAAIKVHSMKGESGKVYRAWINEPYPGDPQSLEAQKPISLDFSGRIVLGNGIICLTVVKLLIKLQQFSTNWGSLSINGSSVSLKVAMLPAVDISDYEDVKL